METTDHPIYNNNFLIQSEVVTNELGIVTASILYRFCDIQENENNGKSFYQSHKALQEYLGIERHIIKSSIDELIELNLLTKHLAPVEGNPTQYIYYVNIDNFIKFVDLLN